MKQIPHIASWEIALWPALSVVLILSVVAIGCDQSSDTTPPETPTGLTATSQDAAIALSWEAGRAEDLAGYNVYRSTSPIEEISGLEPINGGELIAEPSTTDDGVQNGTTYRYVVTAVDEAGNESEPSEGVEKTPFATPPNRP